MDAMKKQYDGHVWTKTQTTNITNDVGLAFCSSTCVGHLQCQNPSCEYLQRAHRLFEVINTEFDGFTKESFPLSGIVSSGSTIVYNLPNALHYARPKSSMSMGRIPPKEPAFISEFINIQ